MRTSTNGGSAYDAGASDYRYNSLMQHQESNSVDNVGSAGAAQLVLAGRTGGLAGNGTGEGLSIIVTLLGQTNASLWTRVQWQGSYLNQLSEYLNTMGGGVRAAAADVDAIRFLFSSGNITSGGWAIYGYK
jgi:hypothetical protein